MRQEKRDIKRPECRRLAPALLLAGALAGGFLLLALYQAFLARLPQPVTPDRIGRLDGLVVLTGGPGRVRFALSLLRAGLAPRLLVTGVNPRVDDATFRRAFALEDHLLACCIAIDRRARNTVENAAAAVAWAERRGLHRIGVVSTRWHLPRALLEIERAACARGLSLSLTAIPAAGDRSPAYHPRVMREVAKWAVASLRRMPATAACGEEKQPRGRPHKEGARP